MCSASQEHTKRASNEPAEPIDQADPKMPTVKQSLRTLLRKNVQMNDNAARIKDGGEVRDEHNETMEKATAVVDIGLPRPQGCSTD